MLNIHLVGNASPEGTLNLLHKAKGQKKAVQALWAEMKKNGYKGGRVVISHCSNPEICGLIQSAIHGEFPEADVFKHSYKRYLQLLCRTRRNPNGIRGLN